MMSGGADGVGEPRGERGGKGDARDGGIGQPGDVAAIGWLLDP
jgi:hypothetical protein